MSDKVTLPHQDLAEQAAAGAALPGPLWDFKAFWKERAGSGRQTRVCGAVVRAPPRPPSPAPARLFLTKTCDGNESDMLEGLE